MLKIILMLASIVVAAACQNQTQNEICDQLLPENRAALQPPENLYQMNLERIRGGDGGGLRITLKTTNSSCAFKNFTMQVRHNEFEVPVGQFEPMEEIEFIDCAPGKNNTIIFKSEKKKKQSKVKWMWSSKREVDEVYVIVKIICGEDQFWVDTKSDLKLFWHTPSPRKRALSGGDVASNWNPPF